MQLNKIFSFPLVRCIIKPSVKTQDHYLLKKTRSDHFSVICLVRDAARLTQIIGTRTDVYTLVRNSQCLIEYIPHMQIQQAVSGGQDCLHSKIDPCVRYSRITLGNVLAWR